VFTHLNNSEPFLRQLGLISSPIIFVSLWYKFIRKNKPVWQPGWRFWKRYIYLSVAGIFIKILGFYDLIFMFLLPAAMANILFFLFEAYRNWSDISVIEPSPKHQDPLGAAEQNNDIDSHTMIKLGKQDTLSEFPEAILVPNRETPNPDKTNSELIACPFCAEDIKAKAKKCKHCGEWFEKIM